MVNAENLPVFVSIPHSGEKVPSQVTWLNKPEATLMRDVDRFVDKLYEPSIHNLKLKSVVTEWHRYVVDLNRKTTDFDQNSVVGAPEPGGTHPKGLHWSVTTHMEPLIEEPMTMELHDLLVKQYYQPFHDQVKAVGQNLLQKHSQVYHLDLHSMPSKGTDLHPDPGQDRAEVVISDFHGKSASSEYLEIVMKAYQEAGFQVAYNWPYVGGGITQMYGRPEDGHHTIQVELNRALYMNEETKKLNTETLPDVQSKLENALTAVVAGIKDLSMAAQNKQQKTLSQKIIKQLASLKLAVFVILAMGAMSAWGTIVESMYNDAKRAQETVYHSWYSYTIFFLLSVNLIAVIVDRYPWKRHHVGFISAHVGIILLIIGAVQTRYFGIDGSMAFDIKESRNRVMVAETDLIVYSGLLTGGARKVYEQEVKFIKTPPSKENPHVIEVGSDKIIIDGYRPYSIPQSKVESSDKKTDGPGLRFQIANERVSESDWLMLGREGVDVKNMGPAQIVLARKGAFQYQGGNVLLLETNPQGETLNYKVFTQSKNGMTKNGQAKAGDSIETGWMGLTFRILKYLPHAQEIWTYEALERSTDETIQSIRFQYNGKEYWTGLNSSVRLFSDDSFHVFIYANRQLELDFSLTLDEFRVGRYQGTRRAASYESDVSVFHNKSKQLSTTISMNEPLKYNGFTFYQSSFKEDEMGRPTMSILSVNRDPGRPLKYLGSLLIVFGIIHLFWFKGRKARS